MNPVSLSRPSKVPAASGYASQQPLQAGGPPPVPQQPSPYNTAPLASQYPNAQGAYPPPPAQPYASMPPAAPQQQMYPPQQQPYNSMPPQQAQQMPGPYGSQQPQPGPYGSQAQPGPYGSQPMAQPMMSQPGGQYGQPMGVPQQQPQQARSAQFGGGAPPMGMQQQPGQYGQPPAQPYSQQPVYGNQAAPGVISLIKGQNMSLSKAAPSLVHARIGLGWDVRQTPGAPFDLDSSCFLLTSAGRVRFPQDFIFYNNKQSMDGSVIHFGDNLTGAGEGDDEQMSIDLTRVPPEVQRIVIVCSIYDAEARQQNFGMVQRAFTRIVDQDNSQEIVRYDLTEEACMWSAMVFGEIYRYGPEWKFKAIGSGVQGGLQALCQAYGAM